MLSALPILLASLLVPISAHATQDTSLWRYTTTEKIEFYRVTPLGDLILRTKDGIVVLDPETGETKWTRNDILNPPGAFSSSDVINDVNFSDLYPFPAMQYSPIPFTPYGVLRTNDGIVMIDLGTGESMWDVAGLPLEKVRGHFPVLQHDMVLVYGEGPESKRTFVGVDLATGEVRWRQDTLLRKSPNMPKARGVRSFVGHQHPLVDSDTTFILHVSKDGPLRIDSRTGELLWRSDIDEDVPLLREGYAPMLYEDGVLFTPYKKKLLAVNTSDGSVIWDRRRNFRSRVTQMELTAHGLVVRGRKPDNKDPQKPGSDFFVDLLDPETGTSMWEREFRDLKINTPFVIDDDGILITKRDEFVALDYTDGSSVRVAEFDFEGDDDPRSVERLGTNILLSANQNILSVDRGGTINYHVYYESPGRSFLENLAVFASEAFVYEMNEDCATRPDRSQSRFSCGWVMEDADSVLGPSFQNAQEWANYAFFYTKVPDAAGREGFSLVKIDKRDGEEAGRVWVDERRPEYLLDEPTGRLFMKVSDREIVALAFPAQ